MTTAKRSRRPRAGALLVVGTAAALAGCTDWAMYDVDVAAGKVPAFATMRRSVIPEPYGMVRLPAEGSVPSQSPNGADRPTGYTQVQLDSLGAAVSNPLPADAEVLARGALQFHNYCSACHADTGAGNGPVVAPTKFPLGPAINGATTAARADGYLYGVMDVGRGLMPAYGTRMTEADLWAVVHYVRKLQGQHGGPQAPVGPAPTPQRIQARLAEIRASTSGAEAAASVADVSEPAAAPRPENATAAPAAPEAEAAAGANRR